MYVVCVTESAQVHDSDGNSRAFLALAKGPVWLRCYLRWSVHIPLRIVVSLTLATSSNGLTTSRHFWSTGKLPIRQCMSLTQKFLPLTHAYQLYRKFCVAVAGFKLLAEEWAPLFSPSYQTPTLHIVGMNDVIVVPERAQALIDVSANARVVKHDGGHFIPTKQAWRNFLRDYLRDPFGNVQNPPGPGDAAAGESAAVTPIPSVPASARVSLTGESDPPVKSEVSPDFTGQTQENAA